MSPNYRRLITQRGFNLPIPEVLIVVVGSILLAFFPEDQYFDINTGGLVAVTCGVFSLVIGIPLLFLKVSFFWFDIAYIIIGLAVFLYMKFYVDGPIIFLGLVAFLAAGMVITGTSHLVRRLMAFLLARRRQRAVVSTMQRDQDL
ncbi:hypothetical protein [Corynebacterium sp. A21]|uniref:hypothetical protein n=1 Tax=Corynebacterium sp. A21 TaxID=3457318 RepID=UPI003FD16021